MKSYLSWDRFPGKGRFSLWGCGLIPGKGWRASEEGIKKELSRKERSCL